MNHPSTAPPTPSTQPSRNEPILLPKLRSALSHLYSSNSTSSSAAYAAEANTYLIAFQSRNVRRKIQSLVQRQNDSQVNTQEQEEAKRDILLNHAGSSMYAALSLLLPSVSASAPSIYCNSNSNNSTHETEQLFCAQTLLHRMRRLKLSEAIDFDLEYVTHNGCSNPITLVDFISQCNNYQINENDSFTHWKEVVSFHCQQLSTLFQSMSSSNSNNGSNNSHENDSDNGFLLLLNHILQEYYNQQWMNKNATNFYDSRWGYGNEIEERIKGELTLLVIATITYYNMYLHLLQKQQQPTTKRIGPLMNTLTSAMAVIALRLRYTSTSVHHENRLSISATATAQSLLQEEQLQSDAATNNNNKGATNNTPLVTTILQSMELVSKVASSLSMQQLVPATSNHSNYHHLHPLLSNQTMHQCIYLQLSTLPDALLGGNSTGGIRGRLSIDPRCVQYMNIELSTPQTGISIVMDTLRYILEQQQQQQQITDVEQQCLFLLTCERWAKFVPLPKEFIEQTISYTLNQILPNVDTTSTAAATKIQNAFCSYLISIFEGARLTIPQIMAINVGLAIEATGKMNSHHQSGRKRQSSKSKKRHKEKLHTATNNATIDHEEMAKTEYLHRGNVACHAALLAWDVLYQLFELCLRSASSQESDVAEGEGPIGCICTLVSACLPHLIHNEKEGEAAVTSFVSNVMGSLKVICSSNNASVRALSFEHIPIIHSALVKKTTLSKTESESSNATNNSSGGLHGLTELELCIAKNLAECTIALAEKCTYPLNYFNDLTMDNDEELEIERNDVRDVVRSVTNVNKEIQKVPLLLLDYVLQYCSERIMNSSSSTSNGCKLSPEVAVHVLSSPAKSLQCLAEVMPNLGECHYSKTVQSITQRVLDCISVVCQQVVEAFGLGVHMNEIFPVSRLLCICLSSLSPFFSSLLINSNHLSKELSSRLHQILGQFIFVVVESVKNIPELIVRSSLGDTVYDIRGAMRSPGGEDHVGCIAMMRLTVEDEDLAFTALKTAAQSNNMDVVSVLLELSKIHDRLHSQEMERGVGIWHGQGVTPKSRRVWLKSICKFGFIIAKREPDTGDAIKAELYRLFRSPFLTILSERSDASQAALIYRICEATHDLSSFPAEICSQLFSNDNHSTDNDVLKGTQLIINTVVSGYREFLTLAEPSEATIQWGRMRGALLSLLRSCANPGFTELCVHAIKALNSAECESVKMHSIVQQQPFVSSVFHPLVVSDEVVPAGAFIIVVRDVIDTIVKEAKELSYDNVCRSISICTSVLLQCHESTFAALKSCCLESHCQWEDPRSTIAEAWFFAMNSLLLAYKKLSLPDSEQLQQLVGQSIGLCIHLITNTRVERELPKSARTDGFMSLDGPQSLAIIEFFELVMTAKGIGASVFTLIGSMIREEIKLDYSSIDRGSNRTLVGGAIISATLFRGISGGLPPWTIEYVPSIFKSMFEACGGADAFCLALEAGCDVRLSPDTSSTYGVISPGKKLAGYFFYNTV